MGTVLSRSEALDVASSESAFADLTDLPSNCGDKKKDEKKLLRKREERVSKAAGLKSWDGKNVRAFIKCYECDKRRGIYTRTDDVYMTAMESSQQKLESVSNRLCCGDLLFDDNHPLGQVLVQKKNITCESPIKAGCYNMAGRTLRLKDDCVHCDSLGAPDFLFGLKELREKYLTGGHTYLTICKDFLGSGKKIVKEGGTNAKQEKKKKQSLSGK